MKKTLAMFILIPACTAVLLGQIRARMNDSPRSPSWRAQTVRVAPELRPEGTAGVIGPDIIVSRLDSIAKLGTVGSITSYALSTTSCNLGDAEAEFIISSEPRNHHPLIAQNMYRYANGRLEQIGMAWLKHAFCAADSADATNCAVCQFNFSCEALGVGCSDTYGTFNNSEQTRLGPRSTINAASGVYDFPYLVSNPFDTGDAIYKRLQVDNNDLDPTQNPGARYFMEAFYLTTDEPAWGTQFNNASYRECFVGSLSGSGYLVDYGAPAIAPQKTAIEAWQDIDPQVVINTIDVAGDGAFLLGSRATDNGDGTWHYEYAVYNYNSDLSGGSLSIPVDPCAAITNVGFHDVDYHSGEPYASIDWTPLVTTGAVTWSTDDFATDPDANALRWNTMYNFWFDADTPPVEGTADLGLFKPSAPSIASAGARVPGPRVCPADIEGGDGAITVVDLLTLLGQWGTTPGAAADITGSPEGCPDGQVNVVDLLMMLGAWGACP